MEKSNARRAIRVAVSGTHGVGKTTFCEDLAAALRDHRRGPYSVEVIKDVARHLHAEGVPINQGTADAQYALFFERHVLNLCTHRSVDFVVFDRTIFDSIGYATANANLDKQWISFVKVLSTYLIERVDTYFYVPIEFSIVSDGVRATGLKYQEAVDRAMAEIIHECRPNVISLSGTRSERVARALRAIRMPKRPRG
jgi:thymidylate kinase